MILAIRHFPDKKKPAFVLEEGSQAVVIGYLTDQKRECWLRRAFMCGQRSQWAIKFDCPFTINQLLESTSAKENG